MTKCQLYYSYDQYEELRHIQENYQLQMNQNYNNHQQQQQQQQPQNGLLIDPLSYKFFHLNNQIEKNQLLSSKNDDLTTDLLSNLNNGKKLFKKVTSIPLYNATASSSNPTPQFTPSSSALKRRICYYSNWGVYRELNPPLYPDQIDPALCTHIHFAFARIDPKNLTVVATEEHDNNWTAKINMPLYIRLYGLKRRNPNLRIILAIGGWSAGSEAFNQVTRTQDNRAKLINDTINYLREWNFDGVDLDWEYPGEVERGADVDSKTNFDMLVNEFRLAVDLEAETNAFGKRKLILSSAVASDPKKVDNGYFVANLCQQLDYVCFDKLRLKDVLDR
jgi:hypothetical protein